MIKFEETDEIDSFPSSLMLVYIWDFNIEMRCIMFLMFRYPDVAERQRMLWDAKYQTISKQLNITEAQEKKIKGKLNYVQRFS